MSRVVRIALVLLVLAVAAPVGAQQVKDRPVKCPLCATEFIAYEVIEGSYAGGMDPDFFLRSIPIPVETFQVWMCPTCYYSGLPADYERPLPEEKRKILLTMLAEVKRTRPASIVEKPESQIKIPGWFKWKTAYACYLEMKRPESYLGDVALRGSWVTRVTGNPIESSRKLAAVHKEVREDFMARNEKQLKEKHEGGALHAWYRAMGDLMATEIETVQWTADERPVTMLMAAGFYREAGEPVKARKYLEQVIATAKSEEAKEIAHREVNLLDLERDFQRHALKHFLAAYESGELKGSNREAPCVYLIGELNRRLDNAAEARKWFDRVLALDGVNEDLRKLAREQKAH